MNTLKTGLVVLGLVIGTTAMAQGGHKQKKTPEERAQWRTERLAKEVSLSDAQKSKLTAINLEAIKKHDAIRSDAGMTEDQRKEAMRASHESEKAQLNTVLTAEQQATLKAKREEQRAAGKQRMEEWKSKTPEERAQLKTEHMAQQLSLTDDQKTQLTRVNLAADTKNAAVRADASLTPEAKKAAMQANHKEQREQLKKILTPEQQKALKANKHGKRCAKPRQ